MPKQSRNIKCLKERKKEMKMAQQAKSHPPQQVVQITQEELDVIVIDLTLRELFNDGDKTIIDFNKDVIEKYNIPINERAVKRYWDILDATQFVNPVVGFGNANKLSITTQGYNVMLQYGNYQNYVNAVIGSQRSQTQVVQEANDIEDIEPEEEKASAEETKPLKKKRDDKTF